MGVAVAGCVGVKVGVGVWLAVGVRDGVTEGVAVAVGVWVFGGASGVSVGKIGDFPAALRTNGK